MNQYKILEMKTCNWFRFHTKEYNLLLVRLFLFNNYSKQMILNYTDNFFSLDIEDLCFFRKFRKDGSILFGSVSHEYIAQIYLRDNEKEFFRWENFFRKDTMLDEYHGMNIHDYIKAEK